MTNQLNTSAVLAQVKCPVCKGVAGAERPAGYGPGQCCAISFIRGEVAVCAKVESEKQFVSFWHELEDTLEKALDAFRRRDNKEAYTLAKKAHAMVPQKNPHYEDLEVTLAAFEQVTESYANRAPVDPKTHMAKCIGIVAGKFAATTGEENSPHYAAVAEVLVEAVRSAAKGDHRGAVICCSQAINVLRPLELCEEAEDEVGTIAYYREKQAKAAGEAVEETLARSLILRKRVSKEIPEGEDLTGLVAGCDCADELDYAGADTELSGFLHGLKSVLPNKASVTISKFICDCRAEVKKSAATAAQSPAEAVSVEAAPEPEASESAPEASQEASSKAAPKAAKARGKKARKAAQQAQAAV